MSKALFVFFFFFQAEDGIRDVAVTGVQTCALPIWKYRAFTTHRSRVTSHCLSIRHRSYNFFHFRDVHHHDGVPRAAIQEASVRSLADALLASDAQNRIHLDAPKRIIILVRHPKHAVFHRAIFHTRRRTRAARAALRDDRKLLRFFLARGGNPLGARLMLLLVGHHSSGLRRFTLGCHGPRLSSQSRSFCHTSTSTAGTRNPRLAPVPQ